MVSPYGPIVGMLYIPVDVRPWVISEIMIDKDEMAQYVFQYTVSNMNWIPNAWKMPICRKILAPLSIWAMDRLEAIPVYRNKPAQLTKTFRQSVDALQSGDNLLIFPENPNAKGKNSGYIQGGLGELYSGFTLLAQLYRKKAGKQCRFIPMYCHRRMRTMTFGKPIIYDPSNDPDLERERISQEAWNTMSEIYQEEESQWLKKHNKST